MDSAGQPLDTIRIRLQHGTFGSFRQTCRSLIASEGIKSLFKGAAYPLLTITVQVCPQHHGLVQIYECLVPVHELISASVSECCGVSIIWRSMPSYQRRPGSPAL